MAHTSTHEIHERTHLADEKTTVQLPALIVGGIGLIVALIACMIPVTGLGTPGFGRFWHAYLISFAFILSICLGGIFFVVVTHMVRAGWSVAVRRVPETFASCIPFVGLLGLPIVLSVLLHNGSLYPWAIHAQPHEPAAHAARALPGQLADTSKSGVRNVLQQDGESHAGLAASEDGHSTGEAHAKTGAQESHEAGHQSVYGYQEYDHFTAIKRAYLNPTFFVIRYIAYFVIWTIIARFFYRNSLKQDQTGDIELTNRMQKWAPLSAVTLMLTLTFASFDWLMSLDHHWFSTMFGVYFFAGCAISINAATIITHTLLQRHGMLKGSVNTEHFHDLGKFMFAFVFFWAYVGFSQFMLIWYASIPEETPWFARRGATTVVDDIINGSLRPNSFSGVSLVLLFGHFAIPFAGFMSRHVKRNRNLLFFWACWMLVMQWVDMFWLVMPELNNGVFYLGVPEIGCALGIIGLFVALFITRLAKAPLRPLRDPRLEASLSFHTI